MTWKTLRVKHLANIRVSNVDKLSKPNELPVRLINYTDVYYGDRIVPELELMPATATASQVQTFRVQPGDVLITKDSEVSDDIGVPAYVERSSPDMVCGYHLALLRPIPQQTFGRFLYWAMNSKYVSDQLSVGSTGITRYGLKLDVISQTRIHLPPLAQQQNIANALDVETNQIDALISKRRRFIELLDARAQALRDEWFNHLSSTYGLVAVRRLTTQIEQGWSPTCDSVPAEEDEWGVIRTSAVSSGTFLVNNNKRLPEATNPETRWQLRDGDLLITRGSGSRQMVGSACVARVGNRKLTLSDLVYRVRLTRADSEYVASAILSSQVREQIESSIRTDTGMTLKIRRDDLADIRIPAVPYRVQSLEAAGLAKGLSLLNETRRVVGKQLDLLAERRKALISAMITGEISVPGVGRQS